MPENNPYTTSSNHTGTATPEFVCQNCGCKLFERVKSEAKFSFAKDYQCRQCKEQVPAPVPLWGSWGMILLGCFTALAGLVFLIAGWMNNGMITMGMGVASTIVGMGFISSGYRSFYYR